MPVKDTTNNVNFLPDFTSDISLFEIFPQNTTPEFPGDQIAGAVAGDTPAVFYRHAEYYDGSEQYWMFGIIMLVVVIYIICRLAYLHKYRQLLQAIVASRYLKLAMREERALNHPFSLMLTVNYALVTGLLVYLLGRHFSIIPEPAFLLFLILAAGVLGVLLAKGFVKTIIRHLTGEDGGQEEDRFGLYFFNQVLGIVLIPTVMISAFAKDHLQETALYFSSGLLVLFYLSRLGRGLLAGFNGGSGAFYLFLYLCTLEIAPLIVMIRLLMSKIGWLAEG